MRTFFALLGASIMPGALMAGTPAAAQTFKPAVVNTAISPLETLWHMRVAFDVAAVTCRDADQARTASAYGAFTTRNAVVLAAADEAVSARYKAQYGKKWQAARDQDMAKLRDFFAQPAAQADFCRTAKVSLMLAGSVDSASLISVAIDELPALEEPFWAPQSQFAGSAPTSVVAASAAVPVAPSGF